MAISVTNIGTASSASTQSLSITIPAGGVPAGAFIYFGITKNSSSSSPTISDTAGNTYVTNFGASYLAGTTSNGYYRRTWVGACLPLSSGDTFTFSDTTVGASATTISGIYATGVRSINDPVYTGSTTGGTGTTGTRTLNPPSGGLAIGATATRSSSAVTQTGGFASPPNSVSSTIYQTSGNLISPNGGSITYTASWSTSTAYTVNLTYFYAELPNNNFLAMF